METESTTRAPLRRKRPTASKWRLGLMVGLVSARVLAGESGVAGQPTGAERGTTPLQAETSDTGNGEAEAQAEKAFFHWVDTSISLLPYGWGYRVDPSEQTTLTLEHAQDSAIGDMFLFLDVNFFHDSSAAQQLNAYGEITQRFSVGKILHRDLSVNFFKRSLFEFKDVLIAVNYEWGKGPEVPPEAILLGMGFDLDLREAGILGLLGKFKYLQLNVYARNELTEGVEHGFKDVQITMVGGDSFCIGSARFLVDGYFDWVLGIGKEEWSFHINPQIKLDVEELWGGKPEKFYAGVELDFWWNKYQIPSTPAFDTNQQAVSLLLQYHF